ncbi:DUF3169 family protein [Psychrobacillus sp. Sa2BUA9]|uniref:DUF3169 family protein n=1 Tax=Psychrobacillus faecigallinarum TaxID=2762235 RepID=A0ABR8R8H3_9BACI|nr:DUF3169 family protein [Psychrobacillus faecigallinarum]MBD7944101.1 DUF3169 family protein [Psychrobacillus faecigallinarum]
MKKVITTIISLLLGGLTGFTITLAIMMGKNKIDEAWAQPVNILLYIVLAILFILLVTSLLLIKKLKKVNAQKFVGEQEDLMEEFKYKKFADLNITANTSLILSILAVAISILMSNNSILQIGFILLFIASSIISIFGINLVRKIYPERNLPSVTAKDYENKFMESMDDGEKYVTLQGLYRAHQLFNLFMLISIILAVAFSFFSEQSQMFSITLMCLVMLVVNTSYLVVVRNK